MTKFQTMLVIAGLLFSLTASAQDKQTRDVVNTIEPLPRDLEIELALSALPPHLRDNATVYVLDPDQGFEVARQGTNGFHALVARTDEAALRGSWPFHGLSRGYPHPDFLRSGRRQGADASHP